MKQLPQVSRDLLEAARIVEQGWCQGSMMSPPDKFCLMGAIFRVADCSSHAALMTVKLSQSLGLPSGVVLFGETHPVAAWNDAPERTQAEVVKALQDAAMKAAEEQR